MSCRKICGVLAVWILLVAPAGGSALRDAIANRNVLALERYKGLSPSSAEGQLATGAALSLRHKDEAALAILLPLSRSAADAEIRAGACLALADIYLRQGRYAELGDALECAGPLNGEQRQVLEYARALSGEKPMRLTNAASGKFGARRDAAGLIRVRTEINGRRKNAVIDTDASFCVLTQSEAERLGVRILDRPLTIITATRTDQPMRLGVADRLQFGDAVLENVVFAVLPDKAMRFGSSYNMEAVIGLPVFVALGRIELAKEEGDEYLYYGARPVSPAVSESNLILSGLDPFVLAKGPFGAMLRLAIDTAADKTALNATVLKDYPWLADGAAKARTQWTGAGGSEWDSAARVLDELKLDIAGRPVVLRRVKVHSRGEDDRHGAIGLDVLRQGSGWVIDFEMMTFRLQD